MVRGSGGASGRRSIGIRLPLRRTAKGHPIVMGLSLVVPFGLLGGMARLTSDPSWCCAKSEGFTRNWPGQLG